MARYKKIRYRRLPKSNYHVQRRLVQAQEWKQSGVDPQNWLANAVIFGVDSDDPVGTDHGAGIRTVKHITVDLVKRPFFKFATGVPNAYNYVYPAVVWAVVDVDGLAEYGHAGLLKVLCVVVVAIVAYVR